MMRFLLLSTCLMAFSPTGADALLSCTNLGDDANLRAHDGANKARLFVNELKTECVMCLPEGELEDPVFTENGNILCMSTINPPTHPCPCHQFEGLPASYQKGCSSDELAVAKYKEHLNDKADGFCEETTLKSPCQEMSDFTLIDLYKSLDGGTTGNKVECDKAAAALSKGLIARLKAYDSTTDLDDNDPLIGCSPNGWHFTCSDDTDKRAVNDVVSCYGGFKDGECFWKTLPPTAAPTAPPTAAPTAPPTASPTETPGTGTPAGTLTGTPMATPTPTAAPTAATVGATDSASGTLSGAATVVIVVGTLCIATFALLYIWIFCLSKNTQKVDPADQELA